MNDDSNYNVMDIVLLANCVLAEDCEDQIYGCAGDMNADGGYNVMDIVLLANCVLAETCVGRVNDATKSKINMLDNIVLFESNGFIGGVQMTLAHGSDFTIAMTDKALFADYLTSGNETRLLVITPETDELFSYQGAFEIKDAIVANSQYEVSVELPDVSMLDASSAGMITEYSLSTAYPNPFNPTTSVTLAVPTAGHVSVQVYNLMGQVVATLASGHMDANTYNHLTWDASNVSSGMYFVKAEAEGFVTTEKLMLIK
jgi:hypothetical protein